MKLRPKQKAFIDDYYKPPFNATRSYMKIYNCSYNSARTAAARLKNHNPVVKTYLDEKRAKKKRKSLEGGLIKCVLLT